jgi:hypothetical protein
MAGIHDIDRAARLTWTIVDQWGETCQWSVHCAPRDAADYGDIYAAMDTFFADLDTNDILADCTLTKLSYGEWADHPTFVGFHQIDSVSRSTVSTTTMDLPPQIALAVGWRNTDLNGVGLALGRRRNRTYLGPLSESNDDAGGGRLSAVRRTTIVGRFTDLNDTLETIAPDTGWTDLPGLVVTSPTQGVALIANEIACGRAYDTVRSRRQKVPEVPSYTAL